jgi:hypothetical protein
VIPDDMIKRALDIITNDGFPSCSDPNCNELQIDREYLDDDSALHPVGAFHFHIEWGSQCLDASCSCHRSTDYFHPETIHMHLLRQSETLFWLKDLKAGTPAPNDPDLMLSNDPSLPARIIQRPASRPSLFSYKPEVVTPCGPWLDLPPVKILRARSYVESLLWLICRDMGKDAELERPLKDRWAATASDLWLGGMAGKRAKLRPRFQAAWEEFSRRGGKAYGSDMLALRRELIQSGELKDAQE